MMLNLMTLAEDLGDIFFLDMSRFRKDDAV